MRKISVPDMSLKITNLRLQPHLPGADELQGNCLSETWIIWTISTLFSAGRYIFAAIRFFHEKQTRWLKQTLAARVSWTQPPRLSTECLPDPNGAAHPPTPVRRNGKRCYLMMTSSNGNIFHVTGHLCGEFTGSGEFPTQRPMTRSFDVFFDLRLNKRLSKQPWGWWFETLSWSLWRHCNVLFVYCGVVITQSMFCKVLAKSFPRSIDIWRVLWV